MEILEIKEKQFERKIAWAIQSVMRTLTNLVGESCEVKLRDLTRLNLELFRDLTEITKIQKEIEEINLKEKEGK